MNRPISACVLAFPKCSQAKPPFPHSAFLSHAFALSGINKNYWSVETADWESLMLICTALPCQAEGCLSKNWYRLYCNSGSLSPLSLIVLKIKDNFIVPSKPIVSIAECKLFSWLYPKVSPALALMISQLGWVPLWIRCRFLPLMEYSPLSNNNRPGRKIIIRKKNARLTLPWSCLFSGHGWSNVWNIQFMWGGGYINSTSR